MAPHEKAQGKGPRILVFSTHNISDPGIDLAGSSHLDYPPGVVVIALPCSSGINPRWVVHALKAGFDGVFIAADGSDCAYVSDCTGRTAKVVQQAQELMEKQGYDVRRLKMGAICSVCSQPFVAHMQSFSRALGEMAQQTPANN